ncbi:MAG: hypothetical protein RLZZ370_313 [Bacteroidota bacterium]|jgi:GTP-binding protein HflX
MRRNKTQFVRDHEPETAVLVAVSIKQSNDEYSAEEYLDELALLVHTAGAKTIGRFIQKLDRPSSKTYVGSGKLEEIVAFVTEHKADMVVFDDELSPAQIRNLEGEFKDVKILDRSNLILHIFAQNAQTAQAKWQVALAQNHYLLPRLTRMWTHLSKQKGGIGMRGPGEQEIETDRRALRNQIQVLKDRLKNIEGQAAVQRKGRSSKPRIALVGYTNVGKSTIMNLLTKADILAENKLFATLDTTVRKWDPVDSMGNINACLLSDTVGFIRKLPHELIESFKSTLSEVLEADLLLHVVDAGSPHFEKQMEVVKETLNEIGAGKKPVLLVFNKIDAYVAPKDDFGIETMSLEDFERSWIAKEHHPVVFISASEKTNTQQLQEAILKELKHLKTGNTLTRAD